MAQKRKKRKRKTHYQDYRVQARYSLYKPQLSGVTKDICDLSKAMVFTSAALGVGIMASSTLQKAIPKK